MMAGIKEVQSGEKAQDPVSKLEPSLKAIPCEWRKVFSHRCTLYVFPVCAIVASVVLVSLAFKTPRPGISLGFSFLLFILAMIYCAVANAVMSWLPDSEHKRSGDSESDKTFDMTVVVVL